MARVTKFFPRDSSHCTIQAAVRDTISHVQRLVATRDITGGVDTEKLSDPLASFGQVRLLSCLFADNYFCMTVMESSGRMLILVIGMHRRWLIHY
jgi:hypothetical protein